MPATAPNTDTIRNRVDTAAMFGTLDAVKAQPTLGRFQFRAQNEWVSGSHNRVTIRELYGAGQEDASRSHDFILDAGGPAVLLGHDTGPNPAECLLAALRAAGLIDAHRAESADPQDDATLLGLFSETQAAKAFVNDAAARTVDRALAASGGGACLSRSPLARAVRDVRAGAFVHPPGANRAYAYLAGAPLRHEPVLS